MTFDDFWKDNYEKEYGTCEPYYGIASYAFEIGKRDFDYCKSLLKDLLENPDEINKARATNFLKECAE